MKKLINILVIAIAVFGLAACKSNEEKINEVIEKMNETLPEYDASTGMTFEKVSYDNATKSFHMTFDFENPMYFGALGQMTDESIGQTFISGFMSSEDGQKSLEQFKELGVENAVLTLSCQGSDRTITMPISDF